MPLRFGSSKLIGRWIIATAVASALTILTGGWLVEWTALAPERIWHGQVWRLVTWPLVELGPFSLVFTCVSIWKFGGDLAVRWGDRRLQRFVLQIVIAAGVATTLLAAVTGQGHIMRVGGWAITDALLIAWARQFPREPLRLYQFLELQGQQLVMFTLAAVGVIALYFGPVWMAPELVACALAAWYPRGWLAAS